MDVHEIIKAQEKFLKVFEYYLDHVFSGVKCYEIYGGYVRDKKIYEIYLENKKLDRDKDLQFLKEKFEQTEKHDIDIILYVHLDYNQEIFKRKFIELLNLFGVEAKEIKKKFYHSLG